VAKSITRQFFSEASKRTPQQRWAPLIGTAGWGLLGAIGVAVVAGLEPNLVEEGFVVHVAQRMAAGEHLYRDIVFFSGPLPFELLSVLFRIFGEEIVVGRAAIAVLNAAASGLIYAAGRRAGLGPLAHAGAAFVASAPVLLFPLFSIFYYTTIAFYLGLIAVYAGVRGTDSTRWAAAAGVLVACVSLCKQSIGVTLALALVAGVAAGAPPGRRMLQARAMILGGVGTAVITVAVFALRGDLAELVRCLVVLPVSLEETYTSPFINLWPLGVLDPEIEPNKVIYLPNVLFLKYGFFAEVGSKTTLLAQVLYALPISALAATAIARLTGPLRAPVWLNAALLLAMITNLFPRSDWGHLVFALPPAGLQIVLLAGVPRGERSSEGRAAWVATGLLLVVVGGASWWVHDAVSGPAVHSSWGPRVPQKPVSQIYRMATIPRVIRYVRDRVEPGEPIFVARAEPLLYFATETTNPTPFGGVLPGLREEQERAILEALPHVRYVVMSDIDQPMFHYYSDVLPGVWAYLERHFRIPEDFLLDDSSWMILLERGPDRGPTAIDLVDERPRAREWIRDESGAEKTLSKEPPRLAARHNRRPLPVQLGPWGGGIDFDLQVPPNARFEGDVGFRGMISLTNIHRHPSRSRMMISIGQPGDLQTLQTIPISDARWAGRRWTPVSVDLSSYAGKLVRLRLELVPDIPIETEDLTWWGSPRIALSAGGR
jgi:hypothetical protein